VIRTIAGLIALVLVAVGTWILFFRDRPIRYAGLRQTTVQTIP
jgi:hypothetical protein